MVHHWKLAEGLVDALSRDFVVALVDTVDAKNLWFFIGSCIAKVSVFLARHIWAPLTFVPSQESDIVRATKLVSTARSTLF